MVNPDSEKNNGKNRLQMYCLVPAHHMELLLEVWLSTVAALPAKSTVKSLPNRKSRDSGAWSKMAAVMPSVVVVKIKSRTRSTTIATCTARIDKLPIYR